MTSRVTVEAFHGVPVQVETEDKDGDVVEYVVQPQTISEFFIHSDLKIVSIHELERSE